MTDNIIPYSEKELLEIIYKNTMTIWDHHTGPIFWYAANVPGPFYINIEQLIGKKIAEELLKKITNILKKKTISLQEKSEFIYNEVISSYCTNKPYQKIITSLLKKYKFYDSTTCISGGERRDWFFSIPCAHELHLDHIFLFKEKTFYLHKINKNNSNLKKITHISDLLHYGSSYFDYWIPILEQNNLSMQESYSIVSRGNIGFNKLKSHHINTHALITIDIDFFKKLQINHLITLEKYHELKVYFENKVIWAKKYFLPYVQNNTLKLDIKSQQRYETFLHNDPWDLFQDSTNLKHQKKNQITL